MFRYQITFKGKLIKTDKKTFGANVKIFINIYRKKVDDMKMLFSSFYFLV